MESNTLICPVCGQPLLATPDRLRCDNGHSFDFARQGYCNLLRSNKALHGDNAQMVRARHDFLQKGYYKPLSDMLAERVGQIAAPNATVLESGCGYGYYLAQIGRVRSDLTLIGTDISKEAIRLGAGKNKKIDFFVANTFALPLADYSVDAIVNVFSPMAQREYERILKPSGRIITVTAAQRHLWQLKEFLYRERVRSASPAPCVFDWELCSQESVRFTMNVEKEDVAALAAMTPYFYKTPKQDVERLQACGDMTIEADFTLRIYAVNPTK